MTAMYDVTVIGGGPAGIAAAIAADKSGARVLLIEREARLGGILKQCIHDGFGLLRFQEKLSGPEYAYRFIHTLQQTRVEVHTLSFVTHINALSKTEDDQPLSSNSKGTTGFVVTITSAKGMEKIATQTLIFSTGCRERTARQVAIHGTRPAGVLTAGSAQYYTNILGQLPCRRCVILGSGDIGLIMARRLHLEGAEVLGVYEAKPTPSGLSRNIAQCLDDFAIPLHLNKTVTRVFGDKRLEAVEIMSVNEAMEPIAHTEERIACDGLILSVGLIPENELAERIGVPLSPLTKGPVCDQCNMTRIPGVFSCGNALQVNDLVDYVSESGEIAGRAAAVFAMGKEVHSAPRYAELCPSKDILAVTPQLLNLDSLEDRVTVFFRVREECSSVCVRFMLEHSDRQIEIFSRKYPHLRPPEMERVILNLKNSTLSEHTRIMITVEKARSS
ncbi:MAG: FAD-dependent oxidoreductase [Treponema sp.]|jgi:NADPH-dependent 2,4-dienoyl-CoA reductase/sulfur reductase-like enzyme|nr:FAD-dependent oxidoreductase [Treponema sp.]